MMTSFPYRCINPDCDRENRFAFFHVEKDQPMECPSCHTSDPQHFLRLTTIHLLVKDPDGPVKGVRGIWNYGCDGAKQTFSKGKKPTCSTEYSAITCKDCLEAHKPVEEETEE